jgi:hypothetical protein
LAAGGLGELEDDAAIVADGVDVVAGGSGAAFLEDVGGGRMLKLGACRESCVVGGPETKLTPPGVKGLEGVRSDEATRPVAEDEEEG